MKSPQIYCLTTALLLVTTAACAAELEPWQQAEKTEVWEPVPAVVTVSDEGVPSDAVVLFDGTSLDAWQSLDGSPAGWQVADGAITVVPGTGDIKTRDTFCDVQLHVEWRSPVKITNDEGDVLTGQGRGNSGVFFHERYEVQVLDSHDNETYPNGQASSLYKQHIPLVNATRPPGEWQTYDIIFKSPRFDEQGALAERGTLTVLHNGVLVQNHVQVLGTTEWIGPPKNPAHGCGSLKLQDHGNPVSFRNIWARRL